jgi:hypothetical protein
MDEVELKTSAPAELSQFQAKLDALNHLVISVLILLVVVSGTLTIYLLRQWSSTRKDLAAFRPMAAQVIGQYNNNREWNARMDGFVSKLTDYGRAHPNFVPILMKYGINPAGPSATPAGAAAPAAAGQQKK